MFIPENLSPLPVLPASNEPEASTQTEIDGFVSDETIRAILVGPMLVTPQGTSQIPAGESFAGRDDLTPLDAPPIVTLSSDEAYADEASVESETSSETFEPGEAHPALAEPSHTRVPVPRVIASSAFTRRQRSERRWVIGMGVALLAICGSGTLIQLVSNEADRRSRISQSADPAQTPGATPSKGDKRIGPKSLAASNPEYPAP